MSEKKRTSELVAEWREDDGGKMCDVPRKKKRVIIDDGDDEETTLTSSQLPTTAGSNTGEDEDETLSDPVCDAEEGKENVEEFPEEDDDVGDVTPSWGEGITFNMWFKVRSFRWMKTPFGKSMLVILEGMDKSIREVWTTPTIAETIMMRDSMKTLGQSVYVKTLGRKNSLSEPGRTYFNFITKTKYPPPLSLL